MKKQLLLFILLFFPLLASAEEVEIDGLWYNLVTKAKVAEVIKYKNNQRYSGDIVIPETVTYEDVDYNVTSIGVGAFEYCSKLTSISIPQSVTMIGSGVFYGTGLTSFTFPEGITKIESCLFMNCSKLTSVSIPESVVKIGDMAFYNCSSLSSITIPQGVTIIDDCAFSGCSSLYAIYITDLEAWCNIEYSSNAGPCFSSYHLYLNGEDIKDLIIPSTISTIKNYAFFGCSGLNTVIIPNNVTTIGEHSFRECCGLSSVAIPNSVTSIGSWAFYNCSALTSISIPNSITSINSYSFNNCTSLASVTLPNSITSIANAFTDCQELTDVYCYAEEVPYTFSDAFDGSYIDYATLHVPASAFEAYRTTEPWSGFGTIVVIDGETPTVEQCATPTITYANGKVRFACETEGVEFVPSIMVTPNQLQNGNELAIGGNFTVSVYAVKEGYDNSDTATMTINMSQMGDVNADGELNAADITAVVNAILGK